MTAQEIRDLRKGITQRELARRLNVTVTTISRWENSEKPIRHVVAIAIRDAVKGDGQAA